MLLTSRWRQRTRMHLQGCLVTWSADTRLNSLAVVAIRDSYHFWVPRVTEVWHKKPTRLRMVGPPGLEPGTKGLWVPCSNQLSYRPASSEECYTNLDNYASKWCVAQVIWFAMTRMLIIWLLSLRSLCFWRVLEIDNDRWSDSIEVTSCTDTICTDLRDDDHIT